jgi:hypothetical protein
MGLLCATGRIEDERVLGRGRPRCWYSDDIKFVGSYFSQGEEADLREAESGSRQSPRRIGEAPSTLPRREEEPQKASYAAMGGGRTDSVGCGGGGCRAAESTERAWASQTAAGGGTTLMMW